MATIRASVEVPASVHEAESCWYDTAGWPQWVDQLARVVLIDGGWPRAGASLIWESGPAGRGRVREQVVAYEPRVGQTVEVQDDTISGRQRVAFAPRGERVRVELSLEYRINRRSPVTLLIDLLFIRRLWAASLRSTLSRFALHLKASRPAGVG